MALADPVSDELVTLKSVHSFQRILSCPPDSRRETHLLSTDFSASRNVPNTPKVALRQHLQRPRFVRAGVGKLAAPPPPSASPSSFHTCPDLSSLQISRPDSARRASVGASDSGERETATGLPRCPSPESLALRSRSRKLASTGKRASKKARSVLGRVRALQRSAAAKMAPSPIKIDTNVATKRGRSQDSDEIPADSLIVDQGASAQRPHSNVPLPPFLCQSYSGRFKARISQDASRKTN